MTPLFRKFLGINWVIVANIIVLIGSTGDIHCN